MSTHTPLGREEFSRFESVPQNFQWPAFQSLLTGKGRANSIVPQSHASNVCSSPQSLVLLAEADDHQRVEQSRCLQKNGTESDSRTFPHFAVIRSQEKLFEPAKRFVLAETL